MSSYKDLEIFREAKRLAITIHKVTLKLPPFEMYEEGSQIRRTSKAIASLIAEGYGRRRYKADYIKYLVISQAECDEVVVHLDFIFETESLKDGQLYHSLKADYDILGKKINRFIHWVEAHEVGKKPK